MEFPRQACLLFVLLGLPVLYPVFCIGLSRRRRGWLISYLAYFFLFGCAGQWLLAVGLTPSGITATLRGGLLTAAPAACLGLAVALQTRPFRLPFDRGALVGCYLYPVFVAAGVALARFGAGG